MRCLQNLPFLLLLLNTSGAEAQSDQATPKLPIEIIDPVEVLPEFPGDFNQWKAAHLVYPQAAKDSSWEGKAIVRFNILKSGRVAEPEIAHSSGYAILDREALRLVKAMPRWKFGGKRIESSWVMPFVFKLD